GKKGKKDTNTIFDEPIEIAELLAIRCQPKYARSSIVIPPIKKKMILCWTPAHINIVRGFVSKSVQSLLDAGDLTGAIKALGGDTSSKENVIDLIKIKINKRIKYYLDLIKLAKKKN